MTQTYMSIDEIPHGASRYYKQKTCAVCNKTFWVKISTDEKRPIVRCGDCRASGIPIPQTPEQRAAYLAYQRKRWQESHPDSKRRRKDVIAPGAQSRATNLQDISTADLERELFRRKFMNRSIKYLDPIEPIFTDLHV